MTYTCKGQLCFFFVGGAGGGGATMTEHDQPCFLVKRNHEITQSDLNNHFHLTWSSINLDGKQSTAYTKMANPSRKTFLHCQYRGHAVKTVTKMQGGEERTKIVEHSMIDKVLRKSTIIATC